MDFTQERKLKVRSLGIDTYRENIIFMHADCHICRSEGFTALTRVVVQHNEQRIIATLNVVYSNLLTAEEAGLSMTALKRLGAEEGDFVQVHHLQPIESLSKVRAKIYGRELAGDDFGPIIKDVVAGHYSNIELAAFITACSDDHLSVQEITGLAKAMVDTGEKIDWEKKPVFDKHCVGGLPGNRTTPIVVSIAAAAGLTIPKTSSRAITSPAGTADTLETMTRVDLPLSEVKEIVKKEGACLAWGNAMHLSPADDVLISIEKALDIDSEGQMIASVLSKKAAAGSTHILIDIPVGETAKVRSNEEALKLQYYFKAVAEQLGLVVEVIMSDGRQPVGRGIGPALEAIDVLAVLGNDPDAPGDLREKSLELSASLLELSGKFPAGKGKEQAGKILESGRAYEKFMAICKAQGGFREPLRAKYSYDVAAARSGRVTAIDNRKLARIAKLAGAPRAPSAGIWFLAPLGKQVKKNDVLFTVFAESTGELEYAKEYLLNVKDLITIN